MTYHDFLASKRHLVACRGIEPPALSAKLFPFQRDLTAWAIRLGSAALFADCGLGKSWMALEWARVVTEHAQAPVLILTPLAVADQFVSEGAKLGVAVHHSRDGSDVRLGVNVSNYERLHRYDPRRFAGVVLDESSCLKDFNSATRNLLIEAFADTRFKLACTATPAPNDHVELGNHAEFLGVMTRTEMLSTFFVHDGGSTQDWRLKRHAAGDFWRWVGQWAAAIRRPSDLGYADDGFVLPPLRMHEHRVDVEDAAVEDGQLFALEARSLDEHRQARRESIGDRVARTAEIVCAEPNEPWLVWCDLNAESEALTAAIPGAVEIRGSDSTEEKESRIRGFVDGSVRVLVTKPSIAGHGLNLQRCARVAFVGLSHSFEAWYQAIRRTYRFGQARPVDCHVVISKREGAVVETLRRKQSDAETLASELVSRMSVRETVLGEAMRAEPYNARARVKLPAWLKTEEAA